MNRQTIRKQIELILVAPDRGGIDDRQFDGFGSWQWVRIQQVRTTGAAFEMAVRVARAPFVAFAEEHGYFRHDWAERLVAAHEAGHPVVGYAIENANPKTLTSWAHLYGQFGPLVAPVESGESNFLAGHHTSYRTDLLLGYGNLLEDLLESETALFLDLRSSGIRMFIAGDAIAGHLNISILGAFMALDYHGLRSFAAARAKVGKWSWWKRVVFASAAPLIPWVRLRRIISDIKRSGRQNILMPKILMPLLPALFAGALGEMVGYVLGPGDSTEKRTLYELERRRYVRDDERWERSSIKSERKLHVS